MISFQDLTKWKNRRRSTKSDHRRKSQDREHVISQMTNGAQTSFKQNEAAVALERCSYDIFFSLMSVTRAAHLALITTHTLCNRTQAPPPTPTPFLHLLLYWILFPYIPIPTGTTGLRATVPLAPALPPPRLHRTHPALICSLVLELC